jgi:hypothetical protein
MSADSTAAASLEPARLDLRSLRVVRYAVGSTLAMAVALGFDWQLSFLTPVLALGFFASTAPRPTLRAGMSFVATVALACLAGLLLSWTLLPYPFVYLPFAGLILFRLFYAKAAGAPPLLITWLLIAILVIPMIAMQSPALANLIARGIVVGALATIGLVWLMHGLLPDPADACVASAPAPATTASTPSSEAAFRTALTSTIVVFPVLAVFYTLQWSGALLILVFVALLSLQPGFAKNFKGGLALIIGNSIGGVAAIIVYELLVIVPEFPFMLLLTLLAGLLLGAKVFSRTPTAPLYGMAFSTLLLVIGQTTSASGEAEAKVYTRVAQIMLAAVYVVFAFGLIERLSRRSEV